MSKAPRTGVIPRDELTSIMTTTAFQTAEAVMRERGLKPDEIAFEYAHRLAYKVWDIQGTPEDAGRSAYRDAVISYMSGVADRELDNWGDEPAPRGILLPRDAVVEAEQAAHLAGLDIRPRDVGLVGEVWATIEVTTKSKPLIRALGMSAIGTFDPLTGTYVVSGSDLVEGLPDHVPSHLKVVNAFIAPLRAQGFVVGVKTVTEAEVRA